MDHNAPLILLSGMGADERILRHQLAAFPNLVVPRWIPPEGCESLPSYAKRLAARIDPGVPCFVGGASFGGFVAIEMAQYLNAIACFLIGSARSPDEFPWRIRVFRTATSLAPVVPFEFFSLLANAVLDISGSLSRPAMRVLLQQMADAAFLRWACRAVLTWRPSGGQRVPVYQIHGGRDQVLPLSCTRPDRIVPGAGHVLSLTHGDEVNAFLRECMGKHVPSDPQREDAARENRPRSNFPIPTCESLSSASKGAMDRRPAK